MALKNNTKLYFVWCEDESVDDGDGYWNYYDSIKDAVAENTNNDAESVEVYEADLKFLGDYGFKPYKIGGKKKT